MILELEITIFIAVVCFRHLLAELRYSKARHNAASPAAHQCCITTSNRITAEAAEPYLSRKNRDTVPMRGIGVLPFMPQLQTSASFLVSQTLGSAGVLAYCALASQAYRLISLGEIALSRVCRKGLHC